MPPAWNPARLTSHHQKRTTRDAGCFEDLLGIAGRSMTEAEYAQRSLAAVANAWAEYDGESRNVAAGNYYPRAKHFVDDGLVVAITDLTASDFLTCFHEHFSRRHVHPSTHGAIGHRQLRYKNFLRFEEQGKLILNVKRIRGV